MCGWGGEGGVAGVGQAEGYNITEDGSSAQ